MSETRYILVGECPDGTPVRYALSHDCVTIGRKGDVVLTEPSVSRSHAELSRVGEGWRIADQGSRNGTFVNGVSVQRKLVVPGDVIKLGKVVLRLVDMDEEDDGQDGETIALTTKAVTFTPSGPGALSLVGRSDALRDAMRMATKAARSNATVLLFGESGTGKELFAKLVWEESERRTKKFLPVHSGAIEPTLLASTLFGYEKGAFTGADKQHKGLFEEADGGTIFLDEIGEINAETQVKLLRVLQEGEFLRVGGTEPIKVDVRVICATNRNLAEAVRAGKFREDLYYRLNVIQINLPPLRERTGDIGDLVNHFVHLLGGVTHSVSSAAMEVLCQYKWPGNVRELRNTIERLVVMAEHEVIDVADLPDELKSWENRSTESGIEQEALPPIGWKVSLAEVEQRHLQAVLEECGGNKSLAAKKLGISRSAFYDKMKGLGVS